LIMTAPLITDTGELDFAAMGKRAHTRACSEYGPHPTFFLPVCAVCGAKKDCAPILTSRCGSQGEWT
jgi:hypothetical protein